MERGWSRFQALDAYETREVKAGDLVRPWIGAGPFFHDVSDAVAERSFFEDLSRMTGEAVFREALAEGEQVMAGAPSEGAVVAYRGETLPYEVVENEEPLLNWGRYFRGNHVAAKFHSARVTPKRAGRAAFRARVRIDNPLIVAVNGTVQYRSFAEGFVRTNASWGGEQELFFDLDLEDGENVLTVGAFRMGRIAAGSFFLQTLDTDLTVRAPLKKTDSQGSRRALEAHRDLCHPSREWYYPEHPVRVVRHMDAPEHGNTTVTCELVSDGKVVARETVQAGMGAVELGTCGELGVTGSFEIRTTSVVDGTRLPSRTFPAVCVRPTGKPVDTETYDKRAAFALAHFAARKDAWALVARYALGRPDEMDREVVEDGCTQIDRRLDCADFVLHPFLRLLYMDREANALPEDVRDRITTAAQGFCYWSDQPRPGCLVTGTENHQILFHTAEIMAGHLWPDLVFRNAKMTGRDHAAHGRQMSAAWLKARSQTGFREWHSSSYYPHWMSALLDLVECVPDQERDLCAASRQVLTQGCLNIAMDCFEGSLVTTHGRVYAPMLKVPDTDGASGIHWLLYGEGHLTNPTAVVPMAAGSFRVPDFFTRIAANDDGVTLTRHHEGNDSRFIVQRCPEYLMCALQDHKPGEKAAQVHPFQITFKDKVAVFFSCPETSNEGGGHRPDYWSGNGYLPRVFGTQNVAIILCKPGEVGWMSHCYFERDRFCEVIERDGWLFARKDEGYMALWSENGYEVGRRGPYAGRELICRGENAWVLEAGRKADWKRFETFVEQIAAVRPARDGEKIVYASPTAGRVEMGWDGDIVEAGETAVLDYPLVDGPYAESAYGSGVLVGRYRGEEVRMGPSD